MKIEDLINYPHLHEALFAPCAKRHEGLAELEALIVARVVEARKQPLGSLVSYFKAQKEMFEQNPQVRAIYAEAEGLVRAFNTQEPIQERIARWLTETLSEEGEEAGLSPLENKEERAVRFVEEALELAQAIGIDREQLHRLVDYVMNRPVGDVAQEVGGSMLTLYAVSAACGVDADAQALKEVQRVETPEIRAKVRRRQKEKREALVARDVPSCRAKAEADQQPWVARADFEELQKRADELERENERTRCDYDKLKDERDQLEKEVLDCEEHAVVELALAECAPTEEERDAYMERDPSELPDLVKEWRINSLHWSSIGFAIHRKLKDAGIAFTDPVGDIEDSLVARVAMLIAQRDRAQKWLSNPILRIPEQLGDKENTVSLPRAEFSKLLAELDRQEAQVQRLQKRGTELVNEARDARIERDALKAAGKSSEAQQEIDHLTKQLSDAWRSIAELEDQALASNNASPSPCAMGKYCDRHEFTHGAEAEELREKLAALCARLEKIPSQRILDMLDKVDARDSVAYLEFRDKDDDEGEDL